MLGGLSQYQEGVDTLQIDFVDGTPVQVNIARNAETTFAQWPSGNLWEYFTEVDGGLAFDLALGFLNLGENSIGVTATYSDASTANAFLTLHISEVPAEEPPPDPEPESPLPAFPGAQGWGAASVGGRGGTVIKVTNLNDSGAGSFRAALTATYPRTIVFTVGGTIDLLSDITLTGANMSYVTVAGQTAPGGGIQTRYKTINIEEGVHDVIFRYWRHRRGWEIVDPPNSNHGPGMTFYAYTLPVYNIIVDHCSFAWAQDDTGCWNKVHDVTFQWCIFAEAKSNLTGEGDLKGTFGKGNIYGCEPEEGDNMYNISVHHNFLVSNHQRNSMLSCEGPLEYVNNVIYNYGAFGTSIQSRSVAGSLVNLIGNNYKAGPDTNTSRYPITLDQEADSPYKSDPVANTISVSDNLATTHRTSIAQDDWDIVGWCGDVGGYCTIGASDVYQRLTPHVMSDYPITIADVEDVPALVLANVGAVRPSRDANDTRLVSEYYLGTGSIHNYNTWPTLASGTAVTDADNDGMADSYESAQGVTDPNAVAANGYTNLENYLNSLV
jgi:hypothetical protein